MEPKPYRLFNASEGARLRDEAIERTGNANVYFKDQALPMVRDVAKRSEYLTTDDVWLSLRQADVIMPTDPRALGAVMKAAQKNQWIAPTDRHKLSQRPACHRRPLRIWKSRLYGLVE